MKKQMYGILATTAIGCSVLLTGCAGEPTEQELGAIQTSIFEYGETEDTATLEGLESLMAKNLKYFDSEAERDELIDVYMSKVFQFTSSLEEKLNIVGYELEDVVEKYNVDPANPMTYSKIPKTNQTVRGFLEEVQAKGFEVVYSTESMRYIIDINEAEMVEKYGQYASESLKTYLEFSAYETTGPASVDIEAETVNMEEVANRIIQLEEGLAIDKRLNYPHVDKWMSATEYYYALLLGISHEMYIESDYVTDATLTEMKDLAAKHKDTQLSTVLTKAVTIYESGNKQVTDKVLADLNVLIDDLFTDEIVKAFEVLYPESTQESEAEDVADATTDEAKTEE